MKEGGLMKTIKLLLAFVFCLAVAVPAMAQKVAKEEKAPQVEKLMPKVVNEEVCTTCNTPSLGIGDLFKNKEAEPALPNNTGEKGAFNYFVESYGSEGWYAEMANEQKGYTLFIDRWVDDGGNSHIARGCYGNEAFCKSLTNGKSCMDAAPGEWCYEPEEPMVAEEFVEMAR